MIFLISIQAQTGGVFSQTGGLDLNCHVFKYLITKQLPNIPFFVFIISKSTGLIDIR